MRNQGGCPNALARCRAQLLGADMKFFSILSLAVVLFLQVSYSYGDYPTERLLRVIPQKESGNNDQAVGDHKKLAHAYGAFQIRQPAVDDVNRKLGTHYKATDCLGNRALSELIFREYINMYATEKKLGHKPTELDMAGIWNGGPLGWKAKRTLAYRQDVQSRLKED